MINMPADERLCSYGPVGKSFSLSPTFLESSTQYSESVIEAAQYLGA